VVKHLGATYIASRPQSAEQRDDVGLELTRVLTFVIENFLHKKYFPETVSASFCAHPRLLGNFLAL
jgi:hypothetical protein